MARPRFQALITDVDWTILDSEQFVFQAFLHTLQSFHLQAITLEELLPHMGKPLEQCYTAFAPEANIPQLVTEHRAHQDNFIHLAKLYPGTRETLLTLRKHGIKIAAVTSRSKQNMYKTLESTKLLPLLDAIIAREDVTIEELKPHPRPNLLALERLLLSPVQAISIGDAHSDIQSGKRAGLQTIGVTYGAAGESIRESNPDYVIASIMDLLPIMLPKN